jgi:hypothetical protein
MRPVPIGRSGVGRNGKVSSVELELYDAASVRSAEFQDQMAELWDLEGRGEYARRARELATVIRTRVDRVRWWNVSLPHALPAGFKRERIRS